MLGEKLIVAYQCHSPPGEGNASALLFVIFFLFMGVSGHIKVKAVLCLSVLALWGL